LIYETIAKYLSEQIGREITFHSRFHPDFVEFCIVSNTLKQKNEILLFSVLVNERSRLSSFHDENFRISNPNFLEVALERTKLRIAEIIKRQDFYGAYYKQL